MATDINTEVKEVSSEELDNLLGMPGADSVITDGGTGAAEAVEKPKFFQKKKVDMAAFEGKDGKTPEELAALAKAEEELAAADAAKKAAAEAGLSEEEKAAAAIAEAKKKEEEEKAAAAAGETSFNELVDGLDENGNAKEKPGRKALDKQGMAQLAQTLIDEKIILPFEEDKKLEEYTVDDFKELFTMNFAQQKKKFEDEIPKEFFGQLPEELQYAAKYVADGGTDMKGLFRALATVEDTKAVTIDTERGQETVVRQYLRAKAFGSDEQIQEEIDSWKDLEKLEAKAQQFKPLLDKMQEQTLQQTIKSQEDKKKKQQDASQKYAESIYETLAKGELNGLKMNNKVQNMLYQGLIQPNYPSISGQDTNLFGHLIEKHQFVEPNHALMAEALWLLADPEGYKTEISKGAKNEAANDTARQLKIEQANKNAGTSSEDDGAGAGKKGGGSSIKRPTKNFFQRQ